MDYNKLKSKYTSFITSTCHNKQKTNEDYFRVYGLNEDNKHILVDQGSLLNPQWVDVLGAEITSFNPYPHLD